MDIDSGYRLLYRVAFRLLRCWWRLRRPHKTGAAIAVWHEQRLLVVRTSYHDRVDLPGGAVEAREDPAEAALRELREETGIDAPPAAIVAGATYRYVDLDRRLTNHVYTWRPPEAPTPVADQREIVWAGFATPAELAAMKLSPLLRTYLAAEDLPGGQPPSGTRQISRA